MEKHFENFGMMIPLDITRYLDGTLMMGSSMEEKKLFTEWYTVNFPELTSMSQQEIQGVFRYWKYAFKIEEKTERSWTIKKHPEGC